jgi:prepilin-type processing-associated H-X9-DG protein
VLPALLIGFLYSGEEESLFMLKFMPFFIIGSFGAFAMFITPFFGIMYGRRALKQIIESKGCLVGRGWAISGILLSFVMWACILISIIGPYINEQIQLRNRSICGHNLCHELGLVIRTYAANNGGKFPAINKWCDTLIEDGYVDNSKFKCPGDRKGPCSYAMNKYVPEIKRDLPEDTVLLFETKGGWNQFGGPEILTFENHKGKGCNILFNDGSARFIKPQEVGELNWGAEDSTNVTNARRPTDDKELKYWLENMVWYHRFTNEEIRAATGFTEKEIIAGLKKFNIWPDNRPKRAADAPLLVLPYPGGRHPRIGFLDGAIDPQRETKFSVFTPWDANSYVVADVPEAIWSNLGLTYLAHTHIDTIWTKKGIELPKLEWIRRSDGTLDIERKLPNGISFGMHVKPTKEAVRMELWLKNGTDQKLSDLRVQNCVMTKMSAGFEQQTNENKVLTNPYVACKSDDGRKWIITAWEYCNNPWANDKCPCFHSDPKFPDLEPGQTHKLHGWLSFYEGTDIKAEFKRIEATGWRKK